MAIMTIKGGPRDGDVIVCACDRACACESFGHGHGNHIRDGYVEWLMYRREGQYWVPDRIERQTMIASGQCPRCDRPMPTGTRYCKNCGAEMDPSIEWSEAEGGSDER